MLISVKTVNIIKYITIYITFICLNNVIYIYNLIFNLFILISNVNSIYVLYYILIYNSNP